MVVTPTFADLLPSKVEAPKGAPPCTVLIATLSDARRAPETLGVVGRRAIYAPTDREGWLKAIFSALKSRGIVTTFQSDPVAQRTQVNLDVSLQTMWVTEGAGGITSTAVVKVQGKGPADRLIDQFYRGNMLKTGYWSGGPSVVQGSIDGAFSKVLDAIAIDLHHMCQA
jgi:hypothetical protein